MFTLFQKSMSNSVHINEIDSIIEDINLIDIREVSEFKNGSIKSATNVPMGHLLAKPDKYLDKSKKYHIMCQSGGRSANAVAFLMRSGYDVVNVTGGMGGYQGRNKR